MSATPMSVHNRPFAIEPVTGTMMPDGIFDNAIFNLKIACHYTNDSGSDLTDVEIYLEGVADPGIVVNARTHRFARIPAGASVLVDWQANFEHATPGKTLVSFVSTAAGFDEQRSIPQIFVSQTRYDEPSNSFSCTVEEGTLVVSAISAIGPDGPRPGGGGHGGGGGGKGCRCECYCDCGGHGDPGDGPYVPTGLTMVWTPNPSFAGTHGELPFADPWWKVLAIIVLIVAALVAIIAAALGAGTASFEVSGTFDENEPSVNCCKPGLGPGQPEFTVAGVASAIATGAALVAMSDEADPIWRGQEATPPAAGEVTTGERVVARWRLPVAPNAGQAYEAEVEWTYTRFTTGATYEHSVTETQVNEHVSGGVEIETPSTVPAYEPLWVRATFENDSGGKFTGTDLYAFALFRSPGGTFILRPLTDDGLGFDPAANDGIYAGHLSLREALKAIVQAGEGDDVRGLWRVYVFAQDVNQSQPGTPPEIAAQEIGGMFVASAIEITFDPSLPCPLEAQSTINVV